MRDKFIVLCVFLLVIAVSVGFQLLSNGATTKPTSTTKPKVTGHDEYRGIALKLHSSDPKIPYKKYVDEIAATGANTISLVISAYQENASSTSIFVDARKIPDDSRIIALIDRAHKKNMKVILMPIVLLENPRADEWRGKISPSNWDAWWEDYTNYIMRYTNIAEKSGVEVMMIGSELLSTEKQADRWRSLIKRVRKSYKGKISYSANWDHYRPIKWWGELDMIGMTTYHDLTGGNKPTVERLMQTWKSLKKEILDWQKKINRPILFTEVGWPNQETCAQYPWNYYGSKKTDPQAQANCFEAFFRTWVDEKTVAGYVIWEWRNYPGREIAPDKDTSYVPCGKKAMEVIRKYLQRPASADKPKSK